MMFVVLVADCEIMTIIIVYYVSDAVPFFCDEEVDYDHKRYCDSYQFFFRPRKKNTTLLQDCDYMGWESK